MLGEGIVFLFCAAAGALFLLLLADAQDARVESPDDAQGREGESVGQGSENIRGTHQLVQPRTLNKSVDNR